MDGTRQASSFGCQVNFLGKHNILAGLLPALEALLMDPKGSGGAEKASAEASTPKRRANTRMLDIFSQESMISPQKRPRFFYAARECMG